MWARDFTLGGATLGALLGLRGGDFRLNSRQVFGALAILLSAFGLEARGFSRGGFLRCCGFGCCMSCGGLFFGRCLNVGGLAATASGRFGGDHRRRGRLGRGVRSTTTRRLSGGRRGAFRAHALFAFPAGANASHLVVAEHAHMAANRDVHLP